MCKLKISRFRWAEKKKKCSDEQIMRCLKNIIDNSYFNNRTSSGCFDGLLFHYWFELNSELQMREKKLYFFFIAFLVTVSYFYINLFCTDSHLDDL